MPEGFSVKVDDGGVRDLIRRLRAIGEDPEPLNRNAAIWLTSRIKEDHFKNQVDEDGVPWAPMSALTRALRRKGPGKGTAKLLRDTGRLRNSITYDADGHGFRVGTNIKYAAVQQFGTESLPGGVIRPKRFRYLYIPAGEDKKRTKAVRPFTPGAYPTQAVHLCQR